MPSGRPASGRNAAKSVASRVARSVSTTGSWWWLSAAGAAMARQVLEHRQDAAGHAAPARSRRRWRRPCRLGAIGAVADHRVAAGDRNVGDRQAVDVDAKSAQVCRDQMAGQAEQRPGRADARGRRARHSARRADRPANAAARAAAPGRLPGPPARALPSRRCHEMSELVSVTWCGVLTFRLKMIRPQGWASRRNARSLAEIVESRQSGDECACRHRRGLARARRKGQAYGALIPSG